MIKFSVSLLLFLGFTVSVFGQSDKKEHIQKLSDVKKTIQNKKSEKNKLIKKETDFKKEIADLNLGISKAETELKKNSADINEAHKNMQKSFENYNRYFSKMELWQNHAVSDAEIYNKITILHSYEQNPVEHKVLQVRLKKDLENWRIEKSKAEISHSDMERWRFAEKKLSELYRHGKKLVLQHKSKVNEKNEMLKQVSGKRRNVEKELANLNKTEKELKQLINKIETKKRKEEKLKILKSATKKQAKQQNVKLPIKLQSFPRPVKGKIVLDFGKTKDMELNSYVISNGIKIKAANFSDVKSIAKGKVVFCGSFRSYGKMIIVDHDKNATFSIYGFLDKILVKNNDKIKDGATIARLGKGENNVLYFEIRVNNHPINPVRHFSD
ncbi:MAG: peptidoglycan DD-metalloendopeptidase family protein [Elusimicrobiota bacterium]|jgi:septal ring factor EnvC (AmiA/AmiB activator)|nr:peptidoglycan DD-metalloendopeptidase family protein [Elusimicrobiota bacterium]